MEEIKATEQKATPELKTVEIMPGKSFTANGRTYFVMESFAIGRFPKIEEMEEELNMFSDKKSCHDVMLAAMNQINNLKPGDAYTILYNKINSDQKNAKLIHYTLRLVTAYINYEGEDLGYLTDDQIKSKIEDWSKEGLSVAPFLAFALTVMKEFFLYYKKGIQDILQQAMDIKTALQKTFDMQTLGLTDGAETQ